MSKTITVLPTQLNRPKRKRWGLGLVLISALAFLGFQVVAAVVTLAAYLATQPLSITSANVSEDSILKFATSPGVLIPTQLAAYLLWIGFMFYATYKRGLHSFRKDFWLRFRWYDPFLGILFAGILWGIETGLFFLLSLFPNLDLRGADNGQFLFATSGPWLYIVAIGIGGIIGPLFEELYFRGFIMQAFIRYFRKGLRNYPVTVTGNNMYVRHPRFYVGYLRFKHWLYHHKYVLAALLTGIIFGSIHYQGGTTFGAFMVPVVTGAIGFVLGLIALRTRRLGVNIFTHMGFNMISIVLTLVGVSIG